MDTSSEEIFDFMFSWFIDLFGTHHHGTGFMERGKPTYRLEPKLFDPMPLLVESEVKGLVPRLRRYVHVHLFGPTIHGHLNTPSGLPFQTSFGDRIIELSKGIDDFGVFDDPIVSLQEFKYGDASTS